MGTPVFWTAPSGDADIVLRRYTRGDVECPILNGRGEPRRFHGRVSGIIERVPDTGAVIPPETYDGHQWWPTTCECGYRFVDDDEWQVMQHDVYVAGDGRPGEWHLHEMPVGAVWELSWLSDSPTWLGPDGRAIAVRVPVAGHDWWPDMQASNCTRRCPWWNDVERERHPWHATETRGWLNSGGWTVGAPNPIPPHSERCDPGFRNHKCWVRHGDPVTGSPPLHVDKNGETCAAGAGSIVTPDWHGFLHHGVLA